MNSNGNQRSHLFTLRLWAEDLGDGRSEWRGELRHVLSGKTRYVREWPELFKLLLALMPSPAVHADPSQKHSSKTVETYDHE